MPLYGLHLSCVLVLVSTPPGRFLIHFLALASGERALHLSPAGPSCPAHPAPFIHGSVITLSSGKLT